MSAALWLSGTLAIIGLVSVCLALYVSDRMIFSAKARDLTWLALILSAPTLVFGVIWVILAIMHWWSDWIGILLIVLLVGYFICPTIERDEADDLNVIWMGHRWIYQDGKWKKV